MKALNEANIYYDLTKAKTFRRRKKNTFNMHLINNTQKIEKSLVSQAHKNKMIMQYSKHSYLMITNFLAYVFFFTIDCNLII